MSEPLEFRGDMELEARTRGLLLRANQPEALGITWETLEEVPAWAETKMAPFLADPFGYAKRKTRPLWKRWARQAAAVLLAVSISLFVLYHTSPTAKAWMDRAFQVVVTWLDENTTFHFGGQQPAGTAADRWRPTWLPEGYLEVEAKTIGSRQRVEFENDVGNLIQLHYMPVQEGSMFDVDNEHSDYSELILNGQTAYLFDSNTEGKPSYLIWYNETGTVTFRLMAELSGGDLLQIAESVIVQNV